ncbi:MAG TPA: methyltransferase domain-containing protein [Terriglobales bacterium]|nr:methyltransferase domain-containing protein [Terriglobales bacterium]
MNTAAAYIMEDPREAMRLELKIDPEAWVRKYMAGRLKPRAEVLSVGCGPGVILRELCALDPSIRATGIDISGERVGDAAHKHAANPRLKFVRGDAHAMQFPSDSFDVVYARMLFEYLKDKGRAAAEMVRVCRPGGMVLFQDLDGQLLWNYPEDPAVQRAVEKVVAGLAKTGFDAFVGRKLFSLAQKAGLKNIDVQVECYHLIVGEIDPAILKQWELKLEIAIPMIAQTLGDERAAREQAQRFLEYLRRPDTLTYSNVFTVVGQKPR